MHTGTGNYYIGQCLVSRMNISRLPGIAGRVDTLFPSAHPFTSARLYRGEYITGTDGEERRVRHDFRVRKGEAVIWSGRPVLVSTPPSTGGTSVLDVFYVYPTSPMVRVWVQGGEGEHHIVLFQEVDRSDSRMFKQRTTGRMLGFAD